jgi:hypothetical protein
LNHAPVARWTPGVEFEQVAGTTMISFLRRFLMHYGIYRRYPLARFSALRNAWRIARA